MKYLKLYEEFDWRERRDEILDKISDKGIDSLTDDERDFLDSFSKGKQQEVHDELIEKDSMYKDSTGLFAFKHLETEVFDDMTNYIGILYTPDLDLYGKIIPGELNGKLVSYKDDIMSPEFSMWGMKFSKEVDGVIYDVFEFTEGYEEELELFLEEVLAYINTNDDI